MNSELQTLYEQDQADRQFSLPADLGKRDSARRRRVEELIDAGELQTPEDYYHAAMVFQHGGTVEYAWRAYELAKRAAEMGYDRWLMRQGKPQKYGTQYIADGPCWKLWPVDTTTTDAERAEWHVPPLAEAQQRAIELTRKRPPQQL
jgi:hypothetical protein